VGEMRFTGKLGNEKNQWLKNLTNMQIVLHLPKSTRKSCPIYSHIELCSYVNSLPSFKTLEVWEMAFSRSLNSSISNYPPCI
jgi:hypothetical protein